MLPRTFTLEEAIPSEEMSEEHVKGQEIVSNYPFSKLNLEPESHQEGEEEA